MKILIEGGPNTVNEALAKVVDDAFWINGGALKKYVGQRLRTYYHITLVQKRRWWFGAVEQIIKTRDSLGHVDYISRVRLPKEK